MKKLFISCLIVASMLIIGCANLQQAGSHFVSGAVGLNRVITLYSASGSVIQQWTGRYNVEIIGGTVRFMDKGKAVQISGTYSIIEQ
jgi:hypothetical protein